MNDRERRKAREERRKKRREERKRAANAPYDHFKNIYDPDNLYAAFQSCKKGVNWKASVQRYEANLFKNIAETSRKLQNGEDVRQGFVEFDLRERGKIRHIRSVHIKERVVQKCLCDRVLVPVLSRTLIYDNGASRTGMGVHFSLKRIAAHLRRFYTENGRSNDGYALIIDFSKFFDSIRHRELMDLIAEQITDKRVRALTASFVGAFGDGVSLGLGSQVSQIASLFYPNKIDHYIKEQLRIRYFGRYMDDMYCIHESKEYLLRCFEDIKAKCEKLGLAVNERKSKIVRIKHGVPFLKGRYVLTDTGKVLRVPTGKSSRVIRKKLAAFRRLHDEGKMDYKDVYQSYQSWRGTYRRRFHAWFRLKRMDDFYNRLFIREDLHGRKD
jgi:hypothetical protein